MEFLERREFPGDAFNKVSQARGLRVVADDREDVDLDRHGRVSWEPTTITSGCR
jgi:hypothetical protein